MNTRTLLILANSWKKGGRCVAGRRASIDGGRVRLGEWIRPVAPSALGDEGELLGSDCEIAPKRQVRPLDIVEVPLAHPSPKAGQPENHEIVPGHRWRYRGSIQKGSLDRLAELPDGLWDTDPNRTDRVAVSDVGCMGKSSSLVVIRPRAFHVQLRQKSYGGYQWRGCFEYGTNSYDLSLTDDVFRNEMSPTLGSRSEFVPPFGDRCLLCISLGGAFGDFHYKLVAAVIRDFD
jgi:hypothetical protein